MGYAWICLKIHKTKVECLHHWSIMDSYKLYRGYWYMVGRLENSAKQEKCLCLLIWQRVDCYIDTRLEMNIWVKRQCDFFCWNLEFCNRWNSLTIHKWALFLQNYKQSNSIIWIYVFVIVGTLPSYSHT